MIQMFRQFSQNKDGASRPKSFADIFYDTFKTFPPVLNDIIKMVLIPLSQFTPNQKKQMHDAAIGNDLEEFEHYFHDNPTGTITKFASELKINNFPTIFSDFMGRFNKKYSLEESPIRELMVLSSLKFINKFNGNKHSFKLGLNPLADLTKDEFRGRLKTLPEPPRKKANHTVLFDNYLRKTLPQRFDWRDNKKVTPVENQGDCGSCWAFAIGAAIESAWAIAGKGSFKHISKKQLVDCYDNGAAGCSEGAFQSDVYDFIINKRRGIINTQVSYPYNIKKGKCRWTKYIGAKLKNYIEIREASDEVLKYYLYNYGPISVDVDAGAVEFEMYKSGVINENICTEETNHSVTIVGYNTDKNGINYWIVKNSWGKKWGENEYFRIERGKNLCGINNSAFIPIV